MATIAEVRHIVSLLMQRPITEAVAMEVKLIDGYQYLEITDGSWALNGIENEMTTGEEHGWIETLLLNSFSNYALRTKAGRVYPGDVTFVLEGTSNNLRETREPDVSVVLKANVKPTSKFIYGAPDLAVEIVSPSQSLDKMRERLQEYFSYGTQQAWLVIPETREIEVHNPDGTSKTYGIGDTISGGDLLPGFTLDVAFVFEQ